MITPQPAGSAENALHRSPLPIGRSAGIPMPKESGVNTSTRLLPALNLRNKIVINKIRTSINPATSIPTA